MRKSIYIIVFLIVTSFGWVEKTQVLITSQSEILIQGKSNINSFKCNYNQDLIKSNLTVTHHKKNNKIQLKGATFLISSTGFDCAHRVISNDLKNVLKADDYPNIKIDVTEIAVQNRKVKATSIITIAGVQKKYDIEIKVNEKTQNVTGALALNIKDFNLKSPKKILGLIKLNDEVSITFNLYLKY